MIDRNTLRSFASRLRASGRDVHAMPSEGGLAKILSLIDLEDIKYVTARIMPVDDGSDGTAIIFTANDVVIATITPKRNANGTQSSDVDVEVFARKSLVNVTLTGATGGSTAAWNEDWEWAYGARVTATYADGRALYLPLSSLDSEDSQLTWRTFVGSLRADVAR